MKKSILLCFFFLFLAFLFVYSDLVSTQEEYALQDDYIPNELLVKFKKDTRLDVIQTAVQSVQGKIISYLGKEISTFQWDPSLSSLRSFRLDPDLLHIKVPDIIGTENAISYFSLEPNIEYAEKNGIVYPTEGYPGYPSIIPNDPLFNMFQWPLKAGLPTPGADISATYAWVISTGSSDIVVAVIDSGVDLNHIDLQSNIWINEDEIPDNEIDDDNNGYIDDYHGWDFYDGDKYPGDAGSHGTHCAGVIGAKGNNQEGIAGVNWDVKIMPLKVGYTPGGGFSISAIINATDYATENGAHLSNNSYVGSLYLQSQYDAIKRARDEGKLFIAAAGNLPPYDNDENPVYPASYGDNREPDELENIIAVAANTWNNDLWSESHYGANSVDLAAPGIVIKSTIPYDEYGAKTGTSMAAPHVAGVAALVWGNRPDLSWTQVKNAINSSVDIKPAFIGKVISDGRLNAYEAIMVYPNIPEAPSNLNAYPTAYNQIKLIWQDNSNVEDCFRVERATNPPNFSEIASVGKKIGTGAVSYQDETCSIGVTYYYRVRAYNTTGNSSYSNTESATIPTGPPYYEPEPLDARFIDGEVCFTWSDNSVNEQGFKIERRSEWDPFWEQKGSVGPNETEFWDHRGLEPDTWYYYRVRAYNSYGYSPYSSPIDVYVPWDLR